jgi:hypothetical protein
MSPSRPHWPAHGPSGSDDKPKASPFAMLLDEAGPADRPIYRPQSDRADRPSQTDLSDQAKPLRHRHADTNAPARDNADCAETSDGEQTCENGQTVVPAKEAIEATATDTTIVADDPPVDPATTLDPDDADGVNIVTLADADADPVPIALPAEAVPTDNAPEAETIIAAHGALRHRVSDSPCKADATQDMKSDESARPHGPHKPAIEADGEGAGNDKDQGSQGKDQGAWRKLHLAGHSPETRPASEIPVQRDPGELVGALKPGLEPGHGTSGWMPSTHVNSAAGMAGGTANVPAPPVVVPLPGLAIAIMAQAQAGRNRFEIRLDPPELGRIDVRLDIDRDGRVTSRLMVDRVETLDLLKRDAPQLERALQQAGLKMSDNALEFSLRQQAFGHDDNRAENAPSPILAEDEQGPLLEEVPQRYGRLLGLGAGLDIRV